LVNYWRATMDNPFTASRVVTGESFCNRRKELKELSYYVQNNQTVLLYSHRRTGKITTRQHQ